jgi:hypothetical protein
MCDLLGGPLSQGTVIDPEVAQKLLRDRCHAAFNLSVTVCAEQNAFPRFGEQLFK